MSAQTIAQAPQHAHRADTVRGAHTPWTHALRAALLAAAIVCVVLLAFAWPSVTAKIQNLPIAAVGSAGQIAQVTSKAPQGALDLHTASSRDDAIAQIQRREVYGAIVLGQSPEILVASAASPVASQALTQLGAQMQQGISQQAIAQLKQALQQAQQRASSPQAGAQPGAPQAVPTVTVTDVVPLSSDDPRGTGLAVAGLPLVIGGIIGGALISLFVSGTWRRLAAVIVYGAAGGLGLAAILQDWFHILQADYWVNAAAIGLGIAATAAVITGLNALMGRAGIAVGAVTTMFVGNPLSSLTQPKEFLPAPWGEVGQWFVPGASGTLLRELSYFPSADAAFPWLVLAGWAVVGTVLIAVGHFRNQPAAVEV
ncbi:ABC transporter permease [Sinomonas sp. JGH33]|uniref:ABC transporter permease n=1 Tax=Sinomonas terricola TaxID=3110330 RepID=A0ABU5TBZ7_9MICC|nr:ABC transporter permease [Sinomonas sp. JGH33]MEA5457201.1 ABC transporter permease [Sinomonas sp. JGH33]